MFLTVLAAFLLAVSGLLFDSYWVKVAPVPYPVIFLSLGFVSASLLFVSMGRSNLPKHPIILVFFSFFVFLLMSTLSSLIAGAGDLLALGMKVSTIIVNLMFFYVGFLTVSSRRKLHFARAFFLFSFLMSGSFATFIPDRFNPNWLSITLAFSVLMILLADGKRRLCYYSILFLLTSLFAYFMLSSRGVAIAALLSACFLFFMAIAPNRFEAFISRLASFGLLFSTIFVSVVGVYIYNSSFYPYLVSLSIQNTGKSLDSSRLERWNLGAQLFLERPLLGWGIDAHIVRAANSDGYGDLHNFWWEVLFRGGLLGGLCFFFIFFFVIYRSARDKPRSEEVVAYLVLFVFMSVYSLGGVTHWPGAYMFWLILGVLLGRAVLNKKSEL